MVDGIFLPILIVAGLVSLGVAISLFGRRRVGLNLAELANRLGLVLETKGGFFKTHSVTGLFHGKSIRVFSYTTGSGKNKITWAALSTEVKAAQGLVFTLRRRVALLDKFLRHFRKNEIMTGDAAFDKNWVLVSNRPEFITVALLPEIRERITSLCAGGASGAQIKLEGSRLQYAEKGSFAQKKVCLRIEKLIPLLLDLAAALEVSADF